MYWLWKWLKSYNNCTFSTWKDKCLFNFLFWIPDSFCTFHYHGRGGTPSLASPDGASLIFYHSEFWTTSACPEKQSCPELFHCVEIFFISQDLWATCPCPEKQCALNSLYWTYIYYQYFDQLSLALKFFTVLNMLFTFRIFEQLALALKNRVCPEFTVLNIYFYHSKFWTTCACPENRVWPECFKPGGCRPFPAPPPRTPLSAYVLSFHELFSFMFSLY